MLILITLAQSIRYYALLHMYLSKRVPTWKPQGCKHLYFETVKPSYNQDTMGQAYMASSQDYPGNVFNL